MSHNEINALLSEALQAAGLPAVTLNSSNMAEITVHGLTVALEYTEKENRLILYCSVGRLPENASSAVYEYLLEANLFGAKTGGGHIGLYSPARTLLYSFGTDVSDRSPAQLANALLRFAEQAVSVIEETKQHLEPAAGTEDMLSFMSSMLMV